MARPPILSGIDCFHCGSEKTSKAGMSKEKQRYRCRDCGKFFIDPKERIMNTKPKPRKGYSWKLLPSEGHLILKLRSIAGKLGRAPTTQEIAQLAKEGRSYQLKDYYLAFGSYLAALEKAGIKKRYKQEFDENDRARMLHELQELSRRLKRPLYGRDFPGARKKGLVSPINHFHIAFGSVPNAIELAGVAPKKIYTRDEMVNILRKLDASLDRPIQCKDIQELNRAGKGPSVNVIAREFGRVSKALLAAGTKRTYKKARKPTKHWQRYTQEELVEQLKELGKRLGRQPT